MEFIKDNLILIIRKTLLEKFRLVLEGREALPIAKILTEAKVVKWINRRNTKGLSMCL